MKTFVIILNLFILFSFSLEAQSGRISTYDIKKDKFILKIEVKKNGKFTLQSFASAKHKKLRAEISDSKELSRLELKPGSEIEGTFRFSEFASAGGLGSTRVTGGTGSGQLRFSKVKGPDGKAVGCPPLCQKSARLKLKIEDQ